MHDWSNFEQILIEQDVPKEDIGLIKDFLNSLPFEARQEVFGIFLAFPEKRDFFVEVLKKKKALAKKFDSKLAEELLEKELGEIKNIEN